MIAAGSPGGPTDVMARLLSQRLQNVIGQGVVVDSRGGGGGTVAAKAVATAEADGYTLLFCNTSVMATIPALSKKAEYDPVKDFTPVAKVSQSEQLLVLHPDVPVKSLKELVAYAKANPGKLTYASPGVGTYTHIAMEYFKHATGTDMLHIPYKGSSAAMTDLLGGRISSYMVTYSVFEGYEREGKLKVIASATDKRIPPRPDLPTIAETVPGYSIDVWFGFMAPAGTPAAILDKIHADVIKVVNEPAFIEKYVKPQAFIPGNLSRSEFATQVKADYAKWGELVKISGVKID
jgi:tripartite-type tricarboxylate transporter receptor subunit TctC